MTPDANRRQSPERIEAEIEQTRAEMGETIDAIQAKLTPEHLKAEAKASLQDAAAHVKDEVVQTAREAAHAAVGSAHEATVDRAGEVAHQAGATAIRASSGLIDTIRRNPLPAALAALGIGWLLMEEGGSSSGSRAAARAYGGRYDDGRSQRGPIDRAQDVTDTAQDRAASLADTAQQAAHEAREQVDDLTDQARHKMEDWREEARHQARRAPSRLEEMVEENPLTVGVVALAVGAAVGLALPDTRYEDRLMGEASDRVMRETRESAQQALHEAQAGAHKAVEQVERVVEKTATKIQEEVPSKPELQAKLDELATEAADETKRIAREAKATAKDEARSQGLIDESR